jgi:hypothetical protein
MRIFLSIILLQFIFIGSVIAGLRPIKDTQTGKWGFEDHAGKLKIKCMYDEYDSHNSFGRTRNFAVVKYQNGWGCIDRDGNFVSQPVFPEKTIAAAAGLEWQKSSPRNASLYEAYDSRQDKWGFSDYTGEWVLLPVYDEIVKDYTFFKGKKCAAVKYEGRWGCVDSNGEFCIKPVLSTQDEIIKATEEWENKAILGVSLYMAYEPQTKKWGVVNYLGNWAVRPVFDAYDKELLFNQDQDFLVVKYKDKWGCVNRTGTFVVKPTFNNYLGARNAGFAWQNSSQRVKIEANKIENYDDGKFKEKNKIAVNKDPLPQKTEKENSKPINTQSSDAQIKGAPPVIRIITPHNGASYTSPEVVFTYEAKTSDGDEPEIMAYINGEFQPRTKGVKRVGNQITLVLPKIQDNCRVQLIAKDKYGQNSDPAVVLLHYSGERPKPNLHLFAVGVSDYDQPDLKLQHAAKDAEDFVSTIMKCNLSPYGEVKSPVLITDKGATDKDIKKGLSNMVSNVDQNDVVLLFFSGHGSKESGETYFLSSNAESDDLFATAVNFDVIKTAAKRLKDKKCKIILFMDACHAGALYGQKSTTENFALSDPGIIGFYSSTETQKSNESEEWENGIFTQALIAGLQGKAVDSQGNITIDELERYIREHVRKATNGKQMPIFENKQGNFILFEKKDQ